MTNSNTFKVSDGDLIIISGCSEGHWSDHLRREFHDVVKKWASDRGLQECKVVLIPGKEEINIKVLTVNDIFENEVLNKK